MVYFPKQDTEWVLLEASDCFFREKKENHMDPEDKMHILVMCR